MWTCRRRLLQKRGRPGVRSARRAGRFVLLWMSVWLCISVFYMTVCVCVSVCLSRHVWSLIIYLQIMTFHLNPNLRRSLPMTGHPLEYCLRSSTSCTRSRPRCCHPCAILASMSKAPPPQHHHLEFNFVVCCDCRCWGFEDSI